MPVRVTHSHVSASPQGADPNRVYGPQWNEDHVIEGLTIGTDVQAHDTDLDAISALATTGVLARTGDATYSPRTITGPAAGVTITNGDGVSGNPTLALANDLAALEGLSSAGMIARTATDTAATRTITAGAMIGVTNGDGVAGNPTVAVTDAELVALGGLTSAANKLPYFTGSGAAALADFTSAGRALVDDADAAAQRTTLGLGTAATQNTGTSGANVPLLNTANTWSLTQTYTLAPVFTDQSGSRTALGLGTAATQNTGTSGANVPLLNGANTWSANQVFASGVVAINNFIFPQLNFTSTNGGSVAQFYSDGFNWNIASQGVGDWFRVNLSTGMMSALRSFAWPAPTTKTSNYTVTDSDSSLIFNGAGSLTVTLPTASSYTGRWITLKTIAAQTVVSASSNVVPLAGGSAGTAILAATAGKWADLQSDGSSWIVMRGN